jgi:hypothetical protein
MKFVLYPLLLKPAYQNLQDTPIFPYFSNIRMLQTCLRISIFRSVTNSHNNKLPLQQFSCDEDIHLPT